MRGLVYDMFCTNCIDDMKKEASELFTLERPNTTIIETSYPKIPMRQLCILIEYLDQNKTHRLDYQEIKNITNYCTRCGTEL
jgi:hypothetical protein